MRYKMTIEPITFIHIGSGSEVDILNYAIVKDTFYRINISSLYEGLKDKPKSEFENIIEKLSNISPNNNDYKEIRKKYIEFLEKGINYLEKNPEKQKGIILYKVKVEKEVQSSYESNIEKVNNQFIINETMHSLPDYKPYIPGSSIKGAIRTALISYLVNELKLEKSDFPYKTNVLDYTKDPGKSTEGEILDYYYKNNQEKYKKNKKGEIVNYFIYKNIQKDPFRALHITDTEGFSLSSLIINQTFNYNTIKKTLLSINILNEYIMQENCSTFILNINEELFEDQINKKQIDAISKNSMIKNDKSKKIKEIFNIKTITEACNKFYFDRLNEDYSHYFNNQNLKIVTKDEIVNKINTNANEFLIRIGRFSQYESMTLDNLREKNDLKFHSRMLVKYNNEYYPVGWAKIKWEELKD